MRPIRVLSLFDGMSCGQIALRELGVPIARYYASEVDKFAIRQTQLNFPGTIQLGDVRQVEVDSICEEGEIDLLIGGSPCQSFSFAGKRAGMKTTENEEIYTLDRYLEIKREGFEFEGQSYLFWEYMRILTDLQKRNPNVLFLLENVEMGKKWERVLSDAIGILGVHINSALVSAQNRKRIYWSNIRLRSEWLFGTVVADIPQPADRGIYLRDILEDEVDEKYFLKDGKTNCLSTVAKDNLILYPPLNKHISKNLKDTSGKANAFLANSRKGALANGMTLLKMPIQLNDCKESGGMQPYQQNRIYDVNGIAPACMANLSCGSYAIYDRYRIRRITPTECARLQTIPEWYKWECSETQQYRMLGNGWTVEVIKHIFSFMDIK